MQKPASKHKIFIAGIFVFACVTYIPYLVPGGPSVAFPWALPLVIDEGTVLYDSFRITSGEVIYRDFFQFQGPVFYYIHAGLFAITTPSITAARALNLLITAITAVLIALLVARNLGFVAGAVAASVHACLLVPMYPYAYPHWLAELLALAGIYLLATSGYHPLRELAGGVCLGLSVATIQSLGLPVFAACMAALALPGITQGRRKDTCVRLFRVFGGALLGISPFILYLSIVGALDPMWYAMVKWVFTHYSEGQKDIAQGYGANLGKYLILHRKVSQPWRGLAMTGLMFIKLLPLFAIGGVIVVTFQGIVNRWRSLDYSNLLISIAAFAGTAPLLLGMTRVDITHIAFVGSFGLCGAAIALHPLGTWNPRFRFLVVLVWVFIGISVTVNFSAKAVMTYQASRKMQGWRGEVLKLGMGHWIDSNVGPDERIVTAWGGLQYLYIRRSAVSFTFLPFNAPKYYSDGQWRDIGSQILKALPPVIDVTQEQGLQVIQRTPELIQHYRLYNNRLLLRVGFTPTNQ